jgi:hypothetical protein
MWSYGVHMESMGEGKVHTVALTSTNAGAGSTESKSLIFGVFPKALPQIIPPYALDAPLD